MYVVSGGGGVLGGVTKAFRFPVFNVHNVLQVPSSYFQAPGIPAEVGGLAVARLLVTKRRCSELTA
jgi:hypothetical protein